MFYEDLMQRGTLQAHATQKRARSSLHGPGRRLGELRGSAPPGVVAPCPVPPIPTLEFGVCRVGSNLITMGEGVCSCLLKECERHTGTYLNPVGNMLKTIPIEHFLTVGGGL